METKHQSSSWNNTFPLLSKNQKEKQKLKKKQAKINKVFINNNLKET